MTQIRKTSFLSMVAIVSIGFGSLGLCFSALGLTVELRPLIPKPLNIPLVVGAIFTVLLNLGVLAAGVGLLTLRTWSFTLSRIVWGVGLFNAILGAISTREMALRQPFIAITSGFSFCVALGICAFLFFGMSRHDFAGIVLRGWSNLYRRRYSPTMETRTTFSDGGIELPLDDPTIQLKQAARYINEGNRSKAIPVVRDLLRKYPNNVDVLYLVSQLQADLAHDQHSPAPIITLDTNQQVDVKVQLKLAVQLINQGKLSEAARIVHDLAKQHPTNADVWYLVGFLQTDLAKKRTAYERAITFDPHHQVAKKALADLDKV